MIRSDTGADRSMSVLSSRAFGACLGSLGLVLAVLLNLGRAPVEAQARGKAVYDAHCTECHGTDGKGDGPAAAYVAPHPRDFSTGRYKIRTTETGSVPTDEDLVRSVRQGL